MKASERFDLSGKVAVITGGAGSIGMAYGRALGESGASVVLADVDEGAATKAADALKADGFAAVGVAVDVRDLASAQAMARAAVDTFGGIDILVNNAAIMRDLPQYGLSNMPVDEWDRVMDVNLRGPLLCTQAVLPSMLERGGGRIINGLSAGAFSRGGIYGISKYALHSLTANLASELGPQGINVNAIAPGLVAAESGYVSLAKDSPIRSAIEAGIPGKKSGPPEDLVGTLLLLCSSAGDWINGQTISVDGGWVMRL
jgi:NAD(P)-dependent dehydrogenase (short-subunit alcohol dehydrogenase family)